MKTAVLHSTHTSLGATFTERAGAQAVESYGDRAAEYMAAREAAGLCDLSSRDALRVTGEDRVSFTQGMCTNDVEALAQWGSAYAAMVTVKGAMVADLRVIKREGDLVLDLEPGRYDPVREFLEKYLISEDAELHDARAELGVLALIGPRSAEVLRGAFGAEASVGRAFTVGEHTCVPLESLLGPGAGVDLLVPAAALAAAWKQLLEHGGPLGLRPIGLEAYEVVRVEEGIPRYGQDMVETTLPLEANFERGINYKKGCYVGQEVIARATFRGHMNRKLVGLELGEEPLEGRAELFAAEKKVGFVTSVVRSPRRGGYIALGYVHRDHLAPGTRLTAKGHPSQVTVCALPFGQR